MSGASHGCLECDSAAAPQEAYVGSDWSGYMCADCSAPAWVSGMACRVCAALLDEEPEDLTVAARKPAPGDPGLCVECVGGAA